MNVYLIVAAAALTLHLAWILWVIFGAIFTRNRPALAMVHGVALIWGAAVEVLPIPCPLTTLEQWAQHRAGLPAYEGAFLVHYLDRLVYPDAAAATFLAGTVIVIGANILLYARRLRRGMYQRRMIAS